MRLDKGHNSVGHALDSDAGSLVGNSFELLVLVAGEDSRDGGIDVRIVVDGGNHGKDAGSREGWSEYWEGGGGLEGNPGIDCVYMCIYIYMYIYVSNIHVCMCICLCIYAYVCIYVCM